jgi:Ca2+-binding EF-hand superfamily protein
MRASSSLMFGWVAVLGLSTAALGSPGGGPGGGGHGGGPGGGGHHGPGAGPGGPGHHGPGGPGHGGHGGPGGRHPGAGFPAGTNPAIGRLDTDGDGQISAAEAAAAGPNAATHIMAADANGDGFVTADELRTYQETQTFARLDRDSDGFLAGSELRGNLAAADTDGDGKVSLQEFRDHLAQLAQQAQARQQLMADFQAADANGDHKLEASEWPATAAAAFATVDTNSDGFVTPREIGAYLQANNGQSPL